MLFRTGIHNFQDCIDFKHDFVLKEHVYQSTLHFMLPSIYHIFFCEPQIIPINFGLIPNPDKLFQTKGKYIFQTRLIFPPWRARRGCFRVSKKSGTQNQSYSERKIAVVPLIAPQLQKTRWIPLKICIKRLDLSHELTSLSLIAFKTEGPL